MADVSDITVFEDSGQAISLGKRHLLVRDYVNAVAALAQGCAMLANQHGEMADELGEPFLLYGRALLCLSREEAGILGNAVPEEDQNEGNKYNGEVKVEESESQPREKEEKKNDKSQTFKLKLDQNKEIFKDLSKRSEDNGEEPSTSTAQYNGKNLPASNKNGDFSEYGDGNDEEDIEDDESSNLQLAWEVLELAKLILLKRGPPGWKLLADIHRLLGEVAMESGNQPGALVDFNACLDIQRKIENLDVRSMAETHYQLGLAYSLGNEFDSSIKEFQEAGNLLEMRIKELESSTEPSIDENPFYSKSGEIKELKQLLPEINEKISDMRDFKKQTCKLVIEGIKNHVAEGSCSNGAGINSDRFSSTEISGACSSETGLSSFKSVSDISHLVKKKRKPEDKAENETPAKKISPEKSIK